MKSLRLFTVCLVGSLAASAALATDDSDGQGKAQHGEMAGTDIVPDRAHKDDGAKYGERDQGREAGKGQGGTQSPSEGETGGAGTHTRGDGAGGGVNSGTGGGGNAGEGSGNGSGAGNGGGNGNGNGNRG